MVKSSKGLRTGTRRKFRKEFRQKFTVTPYLRKFEIGSRVYIKPNPMSPKGMPHSRFIGVTGFVREKRGEAYIVEIVIGSKKKLVMAKPEHLMPVQEGG